MDVVRDHVQSHGTAICANGAVVTDLRTDGDLLSVRPLERGAALHVVRTLREAAPGTSFAVELTTGINYEPAYPPFHLDPGATVAVARSCCTRTPPASARR
ncbi:HAD hydrolase family protein [Streptomyces fimicarius] [Streptomyces griseus]